MKVKFLAFGFFAILTSSAWAQQTSRFNFVSQNKIPNDITLEGKFKEAIEWEDKEGKHLVITSESGIGINPKFKHDNGGSDAELWAKHYIVKDKPLQVWKIYDYIRDCPVDLNASFLPRTLQITDIDKNGLAEIWIMYKTVCHGDVSPSDLKLILMEGGKKHVLRGTTKIQFGKKEYIGGEYTADKNYLSLSKEIQEFGYRIWNDNKTE